MSDFLHLQSTGEELNLWTFVIRIFIALLVGVLIGIDREKRNRPAGMRTHALVCLGATLVSIVEQAMIADVVRLGNSQINVSVGRLTSGVISGVGFLGAGTIVLSEKKIIGLTTAASLWCTACMGVAIGAGYYIAALLICLMVLGILKVLQSIIHVNAQKKLEIQYIHRAETLAYIEKYFYDNGVKVLDMDFHSEVKEDGWLYTTIYSLSIPPKITMPELTTHLTEYKNVYTVITRNV